MKLRTCQPAMLKLSILYNAQIEYTPKTGFSDIAAPFFMFYSLSRLDLVNRLNLVNKGGLKTKFTKSSLGCTLCINYYSLSFALF